MKSFQNVYAFICWIISSGMEMIIFQLQFEIIIENVKQIFIKFIQAILLYFRENINSFPAVIILPIISNYYIPIYRDIVK